MVTRKRTSFKIQAGAVDNDAGLFPEEGAIIFDRSLNDLVAGDGFNWIGLGPQSPVDALAVKLVTPIVQPVSTSPVLPVTFFDTVVYQVGAGIVPTIGDTITMADTYHIDTASDFTLTTDKPNTELLVEWMVNGVLEHTRIISMQSALQIYQAAWVNQIQAATGEVFTLRFTANKVANITIIAVNIGVHEV